MTIQTGFPTIVVLTRARPYESGGKESFDCSSKQYDIAFHPENSNLTDSGILRPGSVNQYIQNTRGVVYLSN